MRRVIKVSASVRFAEDKTEGDAVLCSGECQARPGHFAEEERDGVAGGGRVCNVVADRMGRVWN
jgi:hypothetical protein